MALPSFLAGLLAGELPPDLPWEALLPRLREERLSPFVYTQLRATPQWRALPGLAQQTLSRDFQEFSVRAFLVDAELARAVESLAAIGVPVLLLKGAALGRTVYSSTAERPAGDLDILIASDQVEAARRALHGLGYAAGGFYWLPRWQRRYRAELPMHRQTAEGLRVLLELHWALVEAPYYIDRIPSQEVWQHAQPAPQLPGAFLPDPAVLLIHCCAHLALHHSQEMRLFWLLDLDRLARWPALDWDATLALAQRWQLDLAVSRIMSQVATLFGTPLPAEVAQWLAQPRPDPVQHRLWGVADARPGRAWRRVAATWAVAPPAQRRRYAAWVALRGLLWAPEQLARAVTLNGSHDP